MSRSRVLEAFAAALLEDDPQALYDRAPCGYLSTAPDGTVLKTNATFRTMTGLDRSQLIGRRLVDLLTPGGQVFYETHLAPLVRLRDSVRELAVDLRCADGSVLSVLLNATIERDETGNPAVMRVAVFDATERRRFERELQRVAQEARGAQRAAEEAEQETRRLARTLAGILVPRSLPEIDGLDLAATHRSGRGVASAGGAFYDAFLVDEDCWIVFGEVGGPGVDAAAMTALVRHGARALTLALSEEQRDPVGLRDRLAKLVEHHDASRSWTATVLRLRRRGGGWEVAHASEGDPLFSVTRAPVRETDFKTQFETEFEDGLESELGVEAVEAPKTEGRLELAVGDALVLHTSGLPRVADAHVRNGETGTDSNLAAVPTAERLVVATLRGCDDEGEGDVACLALVVR